MWFNDEADKQESIPVERPDRLRKQVADFRVVRLQFVVDGPRRSKEVLPALICGINDMKCQYVAKGVRVEFLSTPRLAKPLLQPLGLGSTYRCPT